MDRAGPGSYRLDRFEDRGLPRDSAHETVLGMAGKDILIDGTLALRDRGNLDHMVFVDAHGMAGVFAKRTFILPDMGKDFPLYSILYLTNIEADIFCNLPPLFIVLSVVTDDIVLI